MVWDCMILCLEKIQASIKIFVERYDEYNSRIVIFKI